MLNTNKKQIEFAVSNAMLIDNVDLQNKGKGRKFTSKFIEPGVVHYKEFGDVLITKETLDKFINTMTGCPVIITHKDITADNADKERVGVVSNAWYNEADGWYYCEGVIYNAHALDLIQNQDYNVSCTYNFESDKKPLVHNGKNLSMEFTGGEFLHLALVPNPRYERANIVLNSKEQVDNTQWITVKPKGEDSEEYQNIPLDDDVDKNNKEDVKEGVKKFFDEKKGKEDGKGKPKEESKQDNYLRSELDLNKKYKLGDLEFTPLKDKEGILYFKQDRGFLGKEDVYLLKSDLKNIKEIDDKKEKGSQSTKENKENVTMTVLNDLEDFIKGIVENACGKKEVEKEEVEEVENEVDYKKLYEELKAKVDGKEEKTEVVEEKEVEKEEVDNKCKNEAENAEDNIKEVIMSANSDLANNNLIMTEADRIKLGEQY